MADRTIAKRYARALLDVAAERRAIDEVERDLYAVADCFRRSPELRTAIAHPSLTRVRKVDVIRRSFEGKVAPLVVEFLALLVDKGRFGLIGEIATLFDDLSDELQGQLKVKVRTVAPLKPHQRERLLARLKQNMRPQPILEEEIDPEILGGMVLRIGDFLIDGSLRGRMRALKESLLLQERKFNPPPGQR